MNLQNLDNRIEGEVYSDLSHRIAFATDASPYKEMPLGVVFPKTVEDIRQTVLYAAQNQISLIPRGAGTSLAGQVVGSGLVVDISKSFRNILEINPEQRWAIVEPGVILNELNQRLKQYGLFFAPETSTASRCTIGGMLGNNSCGLHSVVYGSARDHIIEVNAILSDGSEACFGPLETAEFQKKTLLDSLEGSIYAGIYRILSDEDNRREIRNEFPEMTLPRKNTGYALDELLDTQPFSQGGPQFNLAKILAGSEGTLAFATRIKINLTPLPPVNKAVLCVHFDTLEQALQANLIALNHNPQAVELMDDQVLKLTEGNILQRQNRFFVQGEPGAILIIEIVDEDDGVIMSTAKEIETEMKAAGLGYHFPLITGEGRVNQVWDLRRSGLGVLSNMPGDAKPVSVIEDTAIHPNLLPDYVADFKETLAGYGLTCVYHAHVGSGEIHTRPILNLKDESDVAVFRKLGEDIARLVKKYNGSLSGEHGDGRLRGEFIPIIFGEKNYQLLREVKEMWDPANLFNPGKIIDSPPMNENLRYSPGQQTREIPTRFDFSDSIGIIRAIERCNGSGDCKNTVRTGKVMCPSYQATNDEMLSTRARANLLREFVSHSSKTNPFDYQELYEVLDLCLSCKSCKSECPSNVDMAKLKAEFLQWYYQSNRPGLRIRLISGINGIYKVASLMPGVFRRLQRIGIIENAVKSILGFHQNRSLPVVSRVTLAKWTGCHLEKLNRAVDCPIKEVVIFNDELSNYIDVDTAIDAIKLLTSLNYRVSVTTAMDSGRVLISSGFLDKARKLISRNVAFLSREVSKDHPLIGFDPSTILSFRDEYIDLSPDEEKKEASVLSKSVFLIEEFLAAEMEAGNIPKSAFTEKESRIIFHGHCHQKALSTTAATKAVLSYPEKYQAEEIDAGCCGMAGTFGYEKEHYELSVKIGELKLFPRVRNADASTFVAAPGLSCRHQISGVTGRETWHPVSILYQALKKE